MQNRRLIRLAVALTVIATSACAHQARRTIAVMGPGVADKCESSDALVVENKTPYPVRVIAADGSPNSFSFSQLLEVVASGRVDTIPRIATAHQGVVLDLEQPRMASGVQPPTAGLRTRCIAQ